MLQNLLAKARELLQGEPLRAIVYGAAVVVWLTTHIAQALAIGHLAVVDLDQALLMATAAAAALTEFARRWTYSPATVAAIVATPPTASGPIAAAVAAGVDSDVVVDAVAATGEPVAPIEEGVG
jgi:hypothetical protein